jgi:hypothetical protein
MSVSEKGIVRSIKSRQIAVTLVSISVNGTATTPVPGGMDARFIGSIVDNGAGDYTINLAAGLAAQADIVPVGVVPTTADRVCRVSAVTRSSIRVVCRSVTGAPANADSDFVLTFFHREYGTNL